MATGTAVEASVEMYQDILKRLEPGVAGIRTDAGLASIAISIKRLADAGERIAIALEKIEGDSSEPSLGR